MSGFCPHDWHGTTEDDLRQQSWGEDYDFWADVDASERIRRRLHPDPSDCPLCDGFGRCWNNADPTSGQFVACSCERGTDDPPGV